MQLSGRCLKTPVVCCKTLVTLAVPPQVLSKASRHSVTPVRAPQGVGVWILE